VKNWSDPIEVAQQYASNNLLGMRIRLHNRFSTNPQGWLPWVFEQISPAGEFRYPSDMFFLENGFRQVARYFSSVKITRYPDSLHVTDVEPLVDYIFSTCPEMAPRLGEALTAYLQAIMTQRGGAIDISKVTGLAKTQAVSGYFRKDGTYVRGYYRSHR